jgi:mannose-6-phosphate isomerase-like protein (cupin superfamily)
MPSWTKKNFAGITDRSPAATMEWRLSRGEILSRQVDVSRFTYAPGTRMPFGHRHQEQEEVYVIVGGSGQMKLDEEIVDLAARRSQRTRRRSTVNADALDECRPMILRHPSRLYR